MRARTLVVGASLAGVRTVQALRRKGYDAPITMIGAETSLPYDRPPLSKEYLLGKVDADALGLIDDAELAALDIDLQLGVRAEAVDLQSRQLTTSAGERIAFGTLIAATGSVPRTLSSGEDLSGIHPLRVIADAAAIREAFASQPRVAIVGGGFIGAEVASAARLLGLEVTLVDPVPTMMLRGVGEHVGAVLAERHRDNGVRLQFGRSVAGIEGRDRVERLVLDDGSYVHADVVVVGIGVDPAVDWLTGCGLDTVGGLACDASLRAGHGVYAVGDVARVGQQDGPRRYEHWTNAGDQATVLAAVLTGVATTYEAQPYVWSDQLGTRLQVWGEVRPQDELRYLHGAPDAEEFVVATGADGVIRSVVAFGARREAMRAQRLLRAGTAWLPGRGPVAAL